jgi:hypothetical protein
MIRFLFRALGLIVLAAAFVTVLYDGTKTIAANELSITPLSQIWVTINAASLEALQTGVERQFPPWVWDPGFKAVLTAPAAAVLAVLGAILLLLGRRKKPLIGYSR